MQIKQLESGVATRLASAAFFDITDRRRRETDERADLGKG